MVTLDSAIDWLRKHWHEQREAPTRLHEAHTTDGELGGLRYSGAFAATLGWSPHVSLQVRAFVICGHPLVHGRTEDCLECFGAGTKEVTLERYPYPMSSALEALGHVVTRAGQLPAQAIICTLAEFGFAVRSTMLMLGLASDAPILGAIRQLFHHYQAGPVATTPWTQLSESQQHAMEAA